MTSSIEVSVRAEYTPNPNSLKFIVSESLYPFMGSLTYASQSEAESASNLLAVRLFDVEGVTKIFIMSNFVTIDKTEEINWKDIHLEIKEIIRTNLSIMKDWAQANAPAPSANKLDDSDARTRIETVLDKIRPALVSDGGNIELVDIVEGDARLRMVGACGTCPSSLMTMKMGVERALLAEVPDIVQSVTQVF